jgi:DNA repair ATPase RecN
MNNAEFLKKLNESTLGPGAGWMKVDFHIHLPTSTDYEYRNLDAMEMLGQELTRGQYRIAVILKHEEFPTKEELSSLQRYCPNTTLIPGAEINVIVDALFKKVVKDHFFHCIVAVDPASAVDYGYLLHSAKEELIYRPGDYPAGFRSSIVDVAAFFRKKGALFIPAHLHQGKSVETSRSIDDLYDDDSFLGFVEDGAFSALEVRSISTAAFFSGKQKTKDDRKIPPAVCVASSDAHNHDHITKRNRATWIRAERPTFSELASALNFRHRVRLVQPTENHAVILGVHVVGSFLPDTWLAFNGGLNALIGAKGSGKTALIECIRFALNTLVPSERIDSVRRHVEHVLGASGYVECLVRQSDGTKLLITRRADSRDRITILNDQDEVKTVDVGDEVTFPISILGWHEIEAVADRADARITLLDRAGDHAEIRNLYEKIHLEIEKARDELPVLQRQVKRLDGKLHLLWALQDKRAALQRLEKTELVGLQQEYEWHLAAEQKIEGLQRTITERSKQLSTIIKSRAAIELAAPPDSERASTLQDAIAIVKESLNLNEKAEEASIKNMDETLNGAVEAITSTTLLLTKEFGLFRDKVYTPRVNALPESDRDILTRQIQVLEETKQLPLVENECKELLSNVRKSAREIKNNCLEICKLRGQIVNKRESLVSELNIELSGVRLRFLKSANKEASNNLQQRYGQEGADIIGYVGGHGKSEFFENLAEVFRKLVEIDTEQSQWQVSSALYDIKFVDFLDVIDDDDIEIALEVGKAGFVPIQNLSAGQRSVAVFPLLLRNSKGPLVIDQPEDNLDNRYIADFISPDLLERKDRQQYLVTSHNANLVVLTDADLIVHVDSNGTNASFPASGFFACESSSVRQSVLDILDGGEAALRARQRKYGVAV